MMTVRQFDLNRFPDDDSSSVGSNGKGEETTCREEEDIEKYSSIDFRNSERQAKKENSCYIPLMSLGILRDLKGRSTNFKGTTTTLPSLDKACNDMSAQKVSTNAIVQLAGEKFVQPCSKKVNCFPFADLSHEDNRDAELVQILLASAEKVGEQDFQKARKLIKQCDARSSMTGTCVQRLVYYFSNALSDRINKEAGDITSMYDCSGTWEMFNLKETSLNPYLAFVALYLKSPLAKFCNFTGVQIISEHLRDARKVHIISFEFTTGLRFILLMHDLARRLNQPLEHLKITAVGTKFKSHMKDAGKQLASFAESLNLPFTFKIVLVEDLLELSVDLFDLDNEEQVAVYSPFVLCMLLSQPAHLDSLMRLIRTINPCVTVITEVEANHTSPNFINRFMESLVFCSAIFDSIASCMADDESNRVAVESLYFELKIRDILAAEGVNSAIRHQGIHKWRELFTAHAMMEIELSVASKDQAYLLLTTLEHSSSCTLHIDGKCLVVGWKGVPIFTVSAWKFQ